MRTIAVARVVVNHALPWPWLKWFESLPVMFFVSGTLVGRLHLRDSWRAVMWGRFNRLAVPTEVYLAFAAVMELTGLLEGDHAPLVHLDVPGLRGAERHLPLVDPAGPSARSRSSVQRWFC
ncbi:MAG: hypothetical protein R2716_08735 [Microthrixaceae bacterium]